MAKNAFRSVGFFCHLNSQLRGYQKTKTFSISDDIFFKFANGIFCPFKFCHNRKYHFRLKSFDDLEAQKKEELKLTFDKSYYKQRKKVFPEFC